MIYLCEVCGVEKDLSEKEAYDQGWDYPPFIGVWGLVSPRSCGKCPMTETAYWQIINGATSLNEKHSKTVMRILAEVPDIDTIVDIETSASTDGNPDA